MDLFEEVPVKRPTPSSDAANGFAKRAEPLAFHCAAVTLIGEAATSSHANWLGIGRFAQGVVLDTILSRMLSFVA